MPCSVREVISTTAAEMPALELLSQSASLSFTSTASARVSASRRLADARLDSSRAGDGVLQPL